MMILFGALFLCLLCHIWFCYHFVKRGLISRLIMRFGCGRSDLFGAKGRLQSVVWHSLNLVIISLPTSRDIVPVVV